MKRRKFSIARLPEYRIWMQMLVRCRNPNSQMWKHYGGRGIKVRFHSFLDFYNEVGPRPPTSSTDGRYTIHRINNNGNYEKGNVKWSTYAEQAAPGNRRNLSRDRFRSGVPELFFTKQFFGYVNSTYGKNIIVDWHPDCCYIDTPF